MPFVNTREGAALLLWANDIDIPRRLCFIGSHGWWGKKAKEAGKLFMRKFIRVGLMNIRITITAGAIGVLFNASAFATTLVVTSTADNGSGTLREALAIASDGDTIDASGVSGTIVLTSGELLVTKNVAIRGAGANRLAVDGNASSRVFHITPGTTVTIAGLTITNGLVTTSWPADVGGGIWNDHATLTVYNCNIRGNSGRAAGGGMINDGRAANATLTVSNCTISGNTAGWGGGLLNAGESGGSAKLTLTASTVSDNLASFYGGGLFNYGNAGNATVAVVASTLSNNSANDSGGGIFNDAESAGNATLTVSTSTLSGNSAVVYGGGILNWGGSGNAALVALADTFANNSASVGGGVHNDAGFGGSAGAEIGDCILKAGASGGNIFNGTTATITSRGYNISSDNGSGLLTATGDRVATDPKLGPLAGNYGPTATHALLPGSPAIDGGNRTVILVLSRNVDQRGFPRPADFGNIANAAGGDGSDVGAFEVQPPCPLTLSYWKNNSKAWPVSTLVLGSQTYSKTELVNLLNSSSSGDASLILAKQLITAKLNILSGTDTTSVSSTIAHADGLLAGYTGKLPYKVKTSSALGKAMTTDGSVLDSYNSGRLTLFCGQ
jgi:hypothetical protein